MLERLGLSAGSVVYLAVVGSLGIAIVTRLLVLLRSSERERRARLEGKGWLDAVRMKSPIDDPVGRALDQGRATIDNNTTVARRVVVPLIVVLTSVVAALPFLDRVPAAMLSVLVGAITVFAGVAARPVIENAFAGLAIAFSRLINIGDTVLLGERYGTVEDISVTHTTIRLWDWRRCVIPNSKMLQSEVINYSLHDRFQWAYVEFWVNYDADLKKVAELAAEACKASAHFAPYEPPVFWVMDLAERGICCWIAAWADSPSSAWVLKCDMRATLVRAFAEHGICPHTYHVEAAARGA